MNLQTDVGVARVTQVCAVFGISREAYYAARRSTVWPPLPAGGTATRSAQQERGYPTTGLAAQYGGAARMRGAELGAAADGRLGRPLMSSAFDTTPSLPRPLIRAIGHLDLRARP
jgi:hypothetical protein